MAKTDVKSMTLEELQLFMGELGEPKFRAKQIFAVSYTHLTLPTNREV